MTIRYDQAGEPVREKSKKKKWFFVAILIALLVLAPGPTAVLFSLFLFVTALWQLLAGRSWLTSFFPKSGRLFGLGAIFVSFVTLIVGGLLLPTDDLSDEAVSAPSADALIQDSASPSQTSSTTPVAGADDPSSEMVHLRTYSGELAFVSGRAENIGDAHSADVLLGELRVKGRAPKTGYGREEFGQRWADVDRNGCDTRNDILARDLRDVTTKSGTRDCVVLTGVLDDPYTGQEINFVRGEGTSNEVQIDHVVSLSDAWQKGAQQLGVDNREIFANDPLNLLAVSGPSNQQKGDGDAATWLPGNRDFRCPLVARQIAVKRLFRIGSA